MIKTCEFKDGTVYEGEWDEESDTPHGKGTMIYADCEMYEGNFQKGNHHGLLLLLLLLLLSLLH